MPSWVPLLFLFAATPEERAIQYLAREVMTWPRENHCFSCHNNGDAARALFLAARSGYVVPREALSETIDFIRQPAEWDKNNKGTAGFSDANLARIQFSAALTEARLADGGPLLAAAKSLLTLQRADGSWQIETGGMPPAPAVYGTPMATYMARRTLEAADSQRFADPIRRATRWLSAELPRNITEAGAMLLALPKSDAVRKKCLDLLVNSQTGDGGWGPQPRVPPEVFDTAVVLLALHAAGATEPIARGREFLIRTQQPSGGWPETTRPGGQISYAEHISTTGWALYALLETGAGSSR